ncbi:PH domain-containing protein [Phreatobacter aquaticus]|uniref:PH domain-containing protein n=1 Tax=Phreatobacter aquaticus TaxID=2570229 RepID=A0A4D7QEZ1_9HYPH|nr:PH domain-containing protein [Phreatobacter aquaticus]QCK85748.1 PH domain-containing protein [Phreatobacter aquaticus]
MSYVTDSLGPGETIVHEASIHWIAYLWPFVTIILGLGIAVLTVTFGSSRLNTSSNGLIWLLGFVPLLVGIVWFLVSRFLTRTTELAVTSRKVVAKWGLIARSTIEQRLEKVESISVDQTFWGRMLNFGHVTVHGTGISETPIKRIADPLTFRRKVEQAIEARREVG